MAGGMVTSIERAPSGSSLIDVLDRVLDKGIVIDAWVRVSLVGIELVTVEARVVVASIETYFAHSEALAELSQQAAPARHDLLPHKVDRRRSRHPVKLLPRADRYRADVTDGHRS